MESKVLLGGIEEVTQIKEKVIELNACIEKKNLLDSKEKQLEKSISKKESLISDEIFKTLKIRRNQIESSFNEQISAISNKIADVQAIKEKTKKKKVLQRMDAETAQLRVEEKELSEEIKSLLKREKISSLLNNRLFYALYFPGSLQDLAYIVFSLVIAFFVIPFAIYFAFFSEQNMIYLALSYIISILVFGGLYLFVGKIRYKHVDVFGDVVSLRKQKFMKIREQNQIRRSIRKDKDESSYNLDSYEKEIEHYQSTLAQLAEKKKEALVQFDEQTMQEIKATITNSHADELSALKDEYQTTYEDNKANLARLNYLKSIIATEYESVLGKENLTLEKLNQIEQALKLNHASTISEAITLINQK